MPTVTRHQVQGYSPEQNRTLDVLHSMQRLARARPFELTSRIAGRLVFPDADDDEAGLRAWRIIRRLERDGLEPDRSPYNPAFRVNLNRLLAIVYRAHCRAGGGAFRMPQADAAAQLGMSGAGVGYMMRQLVEAGHLHRLEQHERRRSWGRFVQWRYIG